MEDMEEVIECWIESPANPMTLLDIPGDILKQGVISSTQDFTNNNRYICRMTRGQWHVLKQAGYRLGEPTSVKVTYKKMNGIFTNCYMGAIDLYHGVPNLEGAIVERVENRCPGEGDNKEDYPTTLILKLTNGSNFFITIKRG